MSNKQRIAFGVKLAPTDPTFRQVSVAALCVLLVGQTYRFLDASFSPDGRFVLEQQCVEEIETFREVGRTLEPDTACARSVVAPVPVTLWFQRNLKWDIVLAPFVGWAAASVWLGFRKR